MSKICSRCRLEKILNEFNKNQRWCRQCQKNRRKETIDIVKDYKRDYYLKNKEIILKKSSEYQKKNRHINQKAGTKWRLKNPDKVKQKRLDEQSRVTYIRWWKRQLDRQYRAEHTLRSRVKAAFRGLLKSKTCEKLLGCTYKYFTDYLALKFQRGMAWENYGLNGWHIDHIIPLSSAKSVEELEKLCHYTNLQPLWAKDNLSKGARHA